MNHSTTSSKPVHRRRSSTLRSSRESCRPRSDTSGGDADNNEMDSVGSSKLRSIKVSRTVLLRAIFVCSLVVAAVLCASISYTVIYRLELDLGEQTYGSVATSALNGARAITQRKIKGGHTMASIMGFAFPDARAWPFVALHGYTEINDELADMSNSNEHGLLPVVDPSVVNVSEYEDFLDNMYRSNGFEDHVGYSDFGFGIWKREVGASETTYTDGRVHDVEPNDYDGTSNYSLIVPLVEVGHKHSTNLLFNMRSEPFRREAIDSVLECAKYKAFAGIQARTFEGDASRRPCLVVTDMLKLLHVAGPAGLIYTPVSPVHDPTTLVAMTATVILWEDVLRNIVPDYVDGLICVISTETQMYTFEIQHGVPMLLGDGDLHDDSYSHLARSVILDDVATAAKASAKYTLTVYPTSTMMRSFETSSPWAVALGVVLTIAISTFVFLSYDCMMRREVTTRQDLMDAKRKYMRFVSHEIRSPMQTVVLGLEIIEKELKLKKSSEECQSASSAATNTRGQQESFLYDVCLDVQENAFTAVEVLNDILLYDKIESHTMALDLENVPIWSLIQRTVQQFQVQAMNSSVELKCVPEGPLQAEAMTADLEAGALGCGRDLNSLCVIGDSVRLQQVFRNLVSNALKFTATNGHITVKAAHVKDSLHSPPSLPRPDSTVIGDSHTFAGMIQIQVVDSGVGLSKEQLSQLFSEGVQFDPNRLQHGGGSGLGLVITKGIVEQHGGTIRAHSDGIGSGTMFVIQLPIFQSETEHMAKEEHAMTVPASIMTEPCSRRILVVDDVMSNRKMLVRLLERSGHSCDTADNGEQALNTIKEDMTAARTTAQHLPFDTILMDFEMPVMNGPDATKQIRSFGYQGFIFGVTGNVLKEDTDHFLNKGADEVLPKPISIARLNESWAKHES